MAETMKGLKRTIYCGDVRMEQIGREEILCGWVQKQRNLGSLLFVDLRDRSGICQIVFDSETQKDLFEKAEKVRGEFVIAVRGVVRERDSKNPNLPTGDVEVLAHELRILSKAQTPPFAIEENSAVNDALRLKYRYLDLRRPDLQRNMMVRHRVAKLARDYFDQQGFLEIETPILIKSTPEGARDYLVPSRVHPGSFYALPQSPQIYKQLLMLAGYDRYIQLARCFRDEDLRADRQPEFTQIDLEMSFVDMDEVISINEGFIKRLFSEILGVELKTPFLRLPYQEAMDRYGSDKPDIRFGFELKDLSSVLGDTSFSVFADALKGGGSVRAINLAGYADRFSRKEIDSLAEFAKTYGARGLAWMKVNENGVLQSPILKFLTEEEQKNILSITEAQTGDLLLFCADCNEVVFDTLGALRCECANRLGILNPKDYRFLWVVDFPLFEYDKEEERYVAKHHPFTSPKDEDMDILLSDPSNARAKAYDIVLNGVEVGGGSIRIFDSDIQKTMFEALGFTEEAAYRRFGYLLDAFRYGTPPHGGMAYGLDRLVMLMTESESIREVIAFPKVQNASELMTSAPDTVEEKQLKELNIDIKLPQKN
jgi:aspartyl-tRNA synthetase